MTTKRLHYISGLVLSLFVGLHIFNHLCSIWGVQTHIAVMETLRPFYRNFITETILMIAVITQIFSGTKMFRTGRKTSLSAFEKLHRWTGLYLALFFIIHVSSVLVGRLILGLDTNFYFGAAGLNTFPFNLFFIPYYCLATISFFGHVSAIHHKKMSRTIFGCTPDRQSKALLVIGFLITAVMLYGLTNQFKGIQLPAEYNVLIGR